MAIIHTYYKYGGTIETHFSQSGPEFMLYAAIEHVIIIFQSSGIKEWEQLQMSFYQHISLCSYALYCSVTMNAHAL